MSEPNKGYEPNLRLLLCGLAMEFGGRSQSVPSGVRNSGGNPFYSQRAQQECLLQAARPRDLPDDATSNGFPLQDSSGLTEASRKTSDMPTGKGRGSQTAGMMPMTGPTGFGQGALKTEGRLPIGMRRWKLELHRRHLRKERNLWVSCSELLKLK